MKAVKLLFPKKRLLATCDTFSVRWRYRSLASNTTPWSCWSATKGPPKRLLVDQGLLLIASRDEFWHPNSLPSSWSSFVKKQRDANGSQVWRILFCQNNWSLDFWKPCVMRRAWPSHCATNRRQGASQSIGVQPWFGPCNLVQSRMCLWEQKVSNAWRRTHLFV